MQGRQPILIISFVFPPYPGIGGRRWAKFAKYLSREGFSVHVITAQNPFNETSLFMDDVKDPSIRTYPLPLSYPLSLIKPVKSLKDKVIYRLDLLKLKLQTKGNYYDRGVLWKAGLITAASKIIKENGIKNIIVTGAPFSLLHHSIDLKKLFPGISLFGDLRDPWTWGSGYGMKLISERRRKHEKEMEMDVVKNFDMIFIPSSEMKLHLTTSYPEFQQKFDILPHAFDGDEIRTSAPKISGSFNMILYGTLYDKSEGVFSSMAQLLKMNPDINLDIYSHDQRYTEHFENAGILHKQISYYKPVPPATLFAGFDKYNAVLIIQPYFAKDHITTKIYEIVYSRKPLILVAAKGKLADFITTNHLGVHILPENIVSELPSVRSNLLNFNSSFDIDRFSFKSLTRELSKHFKQ